MELFELLPEGLERGSFAFERQVNELLSIPPSVEKQKYSEEEMKHALYDYCIGEGTAKSRQLKYGVPPRTLSRKRKQLMEYMHVENENELKDRCLLDKDSVLRNMKGIDLIGRYNIPFLETSESCYILSAANELGSMGMGQDRAKLKVSFNSAIQAKGKAMKEVNILSHFHVRSDSNIFVLVQI
jgi:hypothetical protein